MSQDLNYVRNDLYEKLNAAKLNIMKCKTSDHATLLQLNKFYDDLRSDYLRCELNILIQETDLKTQNLISEYRCLNENVKVQNEIKLEIDYVRESKIQFVNVLAGLFQQKLPHAQALIVPERILNLRYMEDLGIS